MQKKTVNTNLNYANFVKLTICSHCNAKANNMHSYLFKSLLGKKTKLLLSDVICQGRHIEGKVGQNVSTGEK